MAATKVYTSRKEYKISLEERMKNMSPTTKERMMAEALQCGYKEVTVTEHRIETTKADMERRLKNTVPRPRHWKRRFFAFHTKIIYVITDDNNKEIVEG